jgi:hypothetical protein
MERYHAGVLSVERSIVDEGRDDRRNDWIWGRKGSVDRDVLAMRDSAAILLSIVGVGGGYLSRVTVRGIDEMNQDDSTVARDDIEGQNRHHQNSWHASR